MSISCSFVAHNVTFFILIVVHSVYRFEFQNNMDENKMVKGLICSKETNVYGLKP